MKIQKAITKDVEELLIEEVERTRNLSPDEFLLQLIKRKGQCSGVGSQTLICASCPLRRELCLHFEKNANFYTEVTAQEIYKAAVIMFVNKHGKESLVEELI